MNDTALQPKPKWPVVIAIISFLYVTFRCLLFRPSLNSTLISIVLGYAIIASMFCGAFGLAYRRSWGRKVLVLGSWLAISQGAHSLITVISFIGGIPPIFTMLGMLTLMIALCGWPVFLLFCDLLSTGQYGAQEHKLQLQQDNLFASFLHQTFYENAEPAQ